MMRIAMRQKVIHPWDQLESESDDAYIHFLCYRNYGPTRSLNKAYYRYLVDYDGFNGVMNRGIRAPGNWQEECANNNWVQRCAAWDIRNLTTYGAKVAILHAETVVRLAQKNLKLVSKGMAPGDEGFADLINSMKLVAGFLSPELVQSIESKHKPARPVVSSSDDERKQVE
jgi:hypothetical protein